MQKFLNLPTITHHTHKYIHKEVLIKVKQLECTDLATKKKLVFSVEIGLYTSLYLYTGLYTMHSILFKYLTSRKYTLTIIKSFVILKDQQNLAFNIVFLTVFVCFRLV